MAKTLFTTKMALEALRRSFTKLAPKSLLGNPVMFVVYIGAICTTLLLPFQYSIFNVQISGWLWFTVIFANFAEALAEVRGKAQADALRKMRVGVVARRIVNGQEEKVVASVLKRGDEVVCEAGDIIPADGEIVDGIASVDESAITGESAPVIRESGGDRSAVTGGTKVLSDKIVVRVSSEAGRSFLDRMISLVEGAQRKKTPNEIALGILLSCLTLVFLGAVFTLPAFVGYVEAQTHQTAGGMSLFVLVALLVCLIPTTIGGLLSAIGISGIDRLVQRNVLATSGRAVEAAGDVDILLLDKTGTITLGNRQAVEFIPAPTIDERSLAQAAQLSSLADETPEGRSIVVLAKERFNIRQQEVIEHHMHFVPFSAQSRMSGVDMVSQAGTRIEIRKGATEAIKVFAAKHGGTFPKEIEEVVARISNLGGTPLVVAENGLVLGVVYLKDVVKGGIRERFQELRNIGIRTIMVTGDNPLTAAAIAAEAGVDDFMAEARPEDKLARIKAEQTAGHLVAMTGDGTNDAPALAQADVGVAMNSGTQAAREAGNMVDLDSNPTKLIEIVQIGKQLLITRGSLTTFSIANDLAKYFAILPAMFAGLYIAPNGTSVLSSLNVMKLHSPESAILSAVIFNALIIITLIPLALRGIKIPPLNASALLRRNLLIYGLGGVVSPFLGIKLIDILITKMHII